MSIEQKQTEIYIQENLDTMKRSWLVAALAHKRGIISAWFERNNHHRLTILFECKKINNTKLLNAVKEFGYHGKVLRA
jgi:hypothetical protein